MPDLRGKVESRRSCFPARRQDTFSEEKRGSVACCRLGLAEGATSRLFLVQAIFCSWKNSDSGVFCLTGSLKSGGYRKLGKGQWRNEWSTIQ